MFGRRVFDLCERYYLTWLTGDVISLLLWRCTLTNVRVELFFERSNCLWQNRSISVQMLCKTQPSELWNRFLKVGCVFLTRQNGIAMVLFFFLKKDFGFTLKPSSPTTWKLEAAHVELSYCTYEIYKQQWKLSTSTKLKTFRRVTPLTWLLHQLVDLPNLMALMVVLMWSQSLKSLFCQYIKKCFSIM